MKPKKLTKKQREDRACDAIIAGILRGWGQKKWKKVFAKVEMIERLQEAKKREERARRAKGYEPPIYG